MSHWEKKETSLKSGSSTPARRRYFNAEFKRNFIIPSRISRSSSKRVTPTPVQKNSSSPKPILKVSSSYNFKPKIRGGFEFSEPPSVYSVHSTKAKKEFRAFARQIDLANSKAEKVRNDSSEQLKNVLSVIESNKFKLKSIKIPEPNSHPKSRQMFSAVKQCDLKEVMNLIFSSPSLVKITDSVLTI